MMLREFITLVAFIIALGGVITSFAIVQKSSVNLRDSAERIIEMANEIN